MKKYANNAFFLLGLGTCAIFLVSVMTVFEPEEGNFPVLFCLALAFVSLPTGALLWSKEGRGYLAGPGRLKVGAEFNFHGRQQVGEWFLTTLSERKTENDDNDNESPSIVIKSAYSLVRHESSTLRVINDSGTIRLIPT